MIVALILIVPCGYFIVRGLLRESEILPALSLGTATAWGLFIAFLNLALRAGVPFDLAAPLAGGGVLALGMAGASRVRAARWGRGALDRDDLLLLLVGAFPLSLFTLLYQFKGVDSDNFIHYPLVALFLKGYFPHVHPYFPDLPLHGHYGRPLGLAGLLFFGGIGIGTAMVLEAWILQLATLGNVYFLAKRAGAGRPAGAITASLAFFGVNAGFADWLVRPGLAEVMGNNNPVVHAFLFALLNLALAVIRGSTGSAVLLLGLLLGAYDHVYETHFHIVSVALALLAAVLCAPGVLPRTGRGAGRRMAAALGLGFLVMVASGGPTSQFLMAKATGARVDVDRGSPYDAVAAGTQQRISVTFPKRPFLSLTHPRDGRPVALFSLEFLRGQGMGLWLLPVSGLVLIGRRRLLGGACAVMALGAIAVPASFDFGRFNPENFRYIFFAGLMAAICFGMALGEGFRWVTQNAARIGRGWVRLGSGIVVALLCFQAIRFLGFYQQILSLAWAQPGYFQLTERQRLEHFYAEYGDADEQAMAFLARHGRRGERLATNHLGPHGGSSDDLLGDAMVIMAGSQLPLVGHNIRILRGGEGTWTSVDGWSGRAHAFWETGDPEILRDLGADWLYVVPKWLGPGAAKAIGRSPGTIEVFRSAPGGERVLYRVDLGRLAARPDHPEIALRGLRVTSAEGLAQGRREKFVRLRLGVHNDGGKAVSLRAYVFYRIYDRGAKSFYDERDAVGSVHALEAAPGQDIFLRVPFVFPYNLGDYEVTFYVRAREGDVNLGSFRFSLGGDPRG